MLQHLSTIGRQMENLSDDHGARDHAGAGHAVRRVALRALGEAGRGYPRNRVSVSERVRLVRFSAEKRNAPLALGVNRGAPSCGSGVGFGFCATMLRLAVSFTRVF